MCGRGFPSDGGDFLRAVWSWRHESVADSWYDLPLESVSMATVTCASFGLVCFFEVF